MTDSKKFRRGSTVTLTILTFLALMPIVLIIISSFTDEQTLLANGYTFFPEKWSLDAYRYIFIQRDTIFRAYGMTILVTVLGTVISVLVTSMLAYAMSRKDFKYRNVLSFFVFFTMLFSGGIVASYMMYSSVLQIKDSIWALIIPNYLVTAFNVFLVRNYYANNIPEALIESAQLDGATEFQIFRKVIFPLSIPSMATVGLFTGLAYWNDWLNGLYFIRDSRFYNIQNLLMKIMNNIEFLKSGSASVLGVGDTALPGTSVRMAMAVIGILPILLVYPFVQRHFIKGVVVGAVKG